MKQFRDSRYWVTEDGKVLAHHPAVDKWHYSKNGTKCRYIREEKWKYIKLQKPSFYYKVPLYLTKRNATHFYVHRLVAELYCDGYFEGAVVDHIDCNKTNNHYTNLQWCTSDYNNKKGSNPNYPLFAQ